MLLSQSGLNGPIRPYDYSSQVILFPRRDKNHGRLLPRFYGSARFIRFVLALKVSDCHRRRNSGGAQISVCVQDWMLTVFLHFLTAADSTQGFMEVPIWFATCRRPTGSLSAEAYFGTERGDELSMGIVKVSIPDTDHVAQMRQELPYLWWWDRCVRSSFGILTILRSYRRSISKCRRSCMFGVSISPFLKNTMSECRRSHAFIL